MSGAASNPTTASNGLARLRVIFLGSGAFGVPTLAALAAQHEVLAVVSQPGKPAGRGMKLTPTPVSEWAAANAPDMALRTPTDINEAGVAGELRGLQADAWVVIAFGQKLGAGLLDGIFAINLHASVLPRWRGAAPINAAVLAGDSATGNSVITLAQRMDAGLVLGTSARAIDPLTTAGELHDLLSADGPALVLRVLQQHAEGALEPQTQDELLVTKARKLKRADGVIDWAKPAAQVRWLVHGLTPWPGVSVTIGAATVKLLRVREVTGVELASAREVVSVPSTPSTPGTLIDASAGLVACGAGVLQLLEVQPAGGRAMMWADFARGRSPVAGTVLGPEPALVKPPFGGPGGGSVEGPRDGGPS